MTDIVVGIDLGTTFSAMARVTEAGHVEVIPNKEGELITPSAVLVEDGGFVVGRAALGQAMARPGAVAQWIKRNMGEDYHFQGRFTPEQISAAILGKLKADAEDFLGLPVSRVVITVPAYFTSGPREKTKEAGEMAGLHVEDLLDEPEAAAIHFGITSLQEGERVLVCDLGGGTYDATVLLMSGGVLRAEKTRGARKLGGYDWTERLVRMVTPRIAAEAGSDPADDVYLWQRLYDLCEQAKCQLSFRPSVVIPWSQAGKSFQVTITRADFEKECTSLLDEVLDKTARAVGDAGLQMKDLTHVLLVGGSSRLPSFVEGISRVTGKQPRKTRNPDEAVARGAALVAHGFATGNARRGSGRIVIGVPGAGGRRIAVQRSTAHALGTIILRRGPAGPELANDTIIPENTAIPAERDKDDYAVEAGQDTFQVPVVEMNSHGQTQEVRGNYRFTGLTPHPRERLRIRVRFRYDTDKIVQVDAWEAVSGRQLEKDVIPWQEPDLSQLADAEPVTVVLAVDCSGSMSGEKILQARAMLQELAGKYLGDGAGNRSVAVVNFGGTHEIYPSAVLVPPTSSVAEVCSVADRLTVGGGTPMHAGLDNIRQLLAGAPGKRIAIVLTDGHPDSVAQSEQVAATLKAERIVIGVVPIGNDADQAFLRRIGDLHSSITVDSSGRNMTAAILDILGKA
jgi:molecular chaperone DnaK